MKRFKLTIVIWYDPLWLAHFRKSWRLRRYWGAFYSSGKGRILEILAWDIHIVVERFKRELTGIIEEEQGNGR